MISSTSEHRFIQQTLQSFFPQAQLEAHKVAVGRIADVYLPGLEVVFEIQVSPIDPLEVLERNHDYQKANKQVIWLLKKEQFDQEGARSVTRLLSDFPRFYFTLQNEQVTFYDRLELYKEGRPFYLSKPYPVLFSVIKPKGQRPRRYLRKRWELSPCLFEGEVLDRPEASKNPPVNLFLKWHGRRLKQFSQGLFHAFLEKASS